MSDDRSMLGQVQHAPCPARCHAMHWRRGGQAHMSCWVSTPNKRPWWTVSQTSRA